MMEAFLPGRPSLLIAACCALLLVAQTARAEAPPAGRTVCIRGVCFAVEVAVTEQERALGLMNRTALGKDRGMLFVFPGEGIHQFWMKNTRIALDIIFIDGDRRVVSIAKNAQPCRKNPCAIYAPTGNAAYALEINGGLSDRYGFTPGDLVEIR
jgi:uncharacterized membrane protein (UPF0127 family)